MNPSALLRVAILFGLLTAAAAGGVTLFTTEVRPPSEASTAPEGFVLTNLEPREVTSACEPMRPMSPEARDATLTQARLAIPELYEVRKGKGRKGAKKSKTEAFTGVMDLNEASAEELSRIKGLGGKTAENIVKYRLEHGPFRNVSDLTGVTRIGQKLVDKISPHLSVKEPEGGWPAPKGGDKPDEDGDAATGEGASKKASAGDSESGERIDINTASAEELTKVKGLGTKTAENIVKYRTEHGPFTTVDDLTKVTRVGQKLVDKIRDRVTAGKP